MNRKLVKARREAYAAIEEWLYGPEAAAEVRAEEREERRRRAQARRERRVSPATIGASARRESSS